MNIPNYILRDPDSCYVIRDMETLKAWLDYPDQRRDRNDATNTLAMTQFARHVSTMKIPKKKARTLQKEFHQRSREQDGKVYNKWKLYYHFSRFRLPNVGKTIVEGTITPEMREMMASYVTKWIHSIKRFEQQSEKNYDVIVKSEWDPNDLTEEIIRSTKNFPPDWKKEIIELCYAQLSDRPKWIKYMMERQDIWYYSNTECALIDGAKNNNHLECYVTESHTPDIEKAIQTHIAPIGELELKTTKLKEYYEKSQGVINILLRVKDTYPEILAHEPASMSRAWLWHMEDHLRKVVNEKQRTWPELKAIWDAQGVTHTFQEWITNEQNKQTLLNDLNHPFFNRTAKALLKTITRLLNMDDNIYFFEGLSYLTNIPFDRENIDELSAKKEQLESLNPNMNMVDLYETLCKPVEFTLSEEYSLDF